MKFVVATFMTRLAAWVAAQTSLRLSTTPRQLYCPTGVEDAGTADPYSVIRHFPGGSVAWVPVITVPVQVVSRGKVESAAAAQAQLIYEAFSDIQGRPIRMVALDSPETYRILGADVRPPAPLGKNPANNRFEVAFNVDLQAVRIA